MKFPVSGICPAVFTPFFENGEVNLEAIDPYVNLFHAYGISSIYALGGAGEGATLTTEERKAVAEKWVKSCAGKISNVIVNVGTSSIAQSKELAAHAESVGVSMIAAVPPYYYKPPTPKDVAIYMKELITAAPNSPFCYYHIPQMTGVDFKVMDILDEMTKLGITQLKGVKFTSQDLCDLALCVDKYGESITFYYGGDVQMNAGLLSGADSCIGGTFTYACKIGINIFNATKKGDVATSQKEQLKLQKVIGYLKTQGMDVGTQKMVAQEVTGIPFGPGRLPRVHSTKERNDTIIQRLKEMGFFEWVK